MLVRGRRGAAVLLIAAMWLAAACGDDADTVANEAGDAVDDAESQVDDLQEEVEEKLDEAGETVDEGLARGQAEIFRQRLTDLGDDEPSLAIDELERIAGELPAEPDVTGIEDTDGDGDDDDGNVQITVDESSACVMISASAVDVVGGTC